MTAVDAEPTPTRPRRRPRGWLVVTLPAIVYVACAIPLQVSTFTSVFDSRFLTVPESIVVPVQRDQTYVIEGDPERLDHERRIEVEVLDSDGDRVHLDHPDLPWPLSTERGRLFFPRPLARFVPNEDDRYRIRISSTRRTDAVLSLRRDPFAPSSPQAKLHLAGAIAAVVLFVLLFARWRRAASARRHRGA